MKQPLPISVTLIARNEAHNLPRCLQSVKDWVQEIVVVLNDCTDATAAVAKDHGAHVYEHTWTNRRDQKNIALSYATQPWVLALDADEVVSPELAGEIQAFVQTQDLRWHGAEFPRKTWFMNRWITHGDWYPDYSLRLFRRESARWSGSSEHDKISLTGTKTRLTGELLHYSFPTLYGSVTKIEAFAEAFAREQTAAGKKWGLAETLFRVLWRFFRCYVLRRGFMDGYPGFFIAAATAFYTLVRYSRLYELEQGTSPKHKQT